MAGFVNISEMVSLALHSMVLMAARQDELLNVKSIALETNASEAHLAKVLQRLAKAGFVHSIRGPKGGFSLARDPDEISLMDIYEVFEEPVTGPGCPMHLEACPFNTCIFGGIPQRLNQEFANHLKSKRVSDFLLSKKEAL